MGRMLKVEVDKGAVTVGISQKSIAMTAQEFVGMVFLFNKTLAEQKRDPDLLGYEVTSKGSLKALHRTKDFWSGIKADNALAVDELELLPAADTDAATDESEGG